jgi:hypothetical protein
MQRLPDLVEPNVSKFLYNMSASPIHQRLELLFGIFRDRSFPASLKLFLSILLNKLRELRLRFSVRHVHGTRSPQLGPKDVVVLCLFRDGEVYLPHFLDHHRNLGVTHFFFLDNGSKDQSAKMIKAQPDTTLYQCALPYGAYKYLFKRFLCSKHGRNSWALLLDVDECFDFPMSEQVTLRHLITYLDLQGYDAVVGHMLDRFSDRPILDQPPEEENLSEAYPFYSLKELVEQDYSVHFGQTNLLSNETIGSYYGGIRKAFFGTEDLLTKHPLFRLRPGMRMTNNGHDIRWAKVADFSAVLYHFKFTSDFSRVLSRAVTEKGYYGKSLRYVPILKRLEEQPDLGLHTKHSKPFTDTEELLNSGFLRASKDYCNWVEQLA